LPLLLLRDAHMRYNMLRYAVTAARAVVVVVLNAMNVDCSRVTAVKSRCRTRQHSPRQRFVANVTLSNIAR